MAGGQRRVGGGGLEQKRVGGGGSEVREVVLVL